MRRNVLSSLASSVVLALALVAVPTWAQEASPPADEEMVELPPGVALDVLTQLAPFDLPDEPVTLDVARLTLEPGAAIPTHPHPGGEFGIVEAGSVSYGTAEGPAIQVVPGTPDGQAATAMPGAAGEEVTAVAGDVVVVPVGNRSDTRAGADGATILIFEFAPPASAAA